MSMKIEGTPCEGARRFMRTTRTTTRKASPVMTIGWTSVLGINASSCIRTPKRDAVIDTRAPGVAVERHVLGKDRRRHV